MKEITFCIEKESLTMITFSRHVSEFLNHSYLPSFNASLCVGSGDHGMMRILEIKKETVTTWKSLVA